MIRTLAIAAVLTVAAVFSSSASAQVYGSHPYATIPNFQHPSIIVGPNCYTQPVFVPRVVVVRPRPVFVPAPVFVHPRAFGYYVPF